MSGVFCNKRILSRLKVKFYKTIIESAIMDKCDRDNNTKRDLWSDKRR